MPWTLTHARLRAAQGDVAGARRILREVLARTPGHDAARRLLEELSRRPDSEPAKTETGGAAPAGSPEESAPIELDRFRRELGRRGEPAKRRRIRRLERWLARVARGAGDAGGG